MPRIGEPQQRPLLAFDTETTGIDLYHGALPFFVTICDERGGQRYWEWDVDPLTRIPEIPIADMEEIAAWMLDGAYDLVLQNPKFDAQVIDAAARRLDITMPAWPWHRTFDTLLAGHLLSSNTPHNLTDMVLSYRDVDIEPYEKAVEAATQEARRLARSKYPDWAIAKEDRSDMPSAGEKVWKYDMWLPRAMALAEGYPADHPWFHVLAAYGNGDSGCTGPLFATQRQLLRDRGLWTIYLERLKILPIVFDMETRGVTVNGEWLEKLEVEYTEEAAKAGRVCTNIASGLGYDLVLPKGGSNKSLEEFAFGPLNLPVVMVTEKTRKPSLKKAAIEQYESLLPRGSKQLMFIRNLRGKRKRETALAYMAGYRRYWQPWTPVGPVDPVTGAGWYVLHPSLNATGTDTLRWSSNNPNEQNISKQEGFNLRSCFGPAPGREWWSCDAKNIELRIPAYEAGETEMIQLFERPNDPPYFGSYHLLVFDTLHPAMFAKHGKKCKDYYESTWYQWTKNGNFAVQYGAMESSGTADRAYHVPGAQARIQDRFGKIKRLNQSMIAMAEERGYVETMPDKNVCPDRGYPLLCTRTERGKILPTVPLNYHVQGTAMWWMQKGMTRCYEFLEQLNRSEAMFINLMGYAKSMSQRAGYFIVMQIHDELVFDFPAGTGSEPWNTNLPVVKKCMKLMELGGDDIGVPIGVSCKYHASSWDKGLGL